jgi:uroporphyrinogen-III decarboxylase
MKEHHDICNALCCIIGNTEIMLLSATDEETKQKLKSILKNADKIAEIIYSVYDIHNKKE